MLVLLTGGEDRGEVGFALPAADVGGGEVRGRGERPRAPARMWNGRRQSAPPSWLATRTPARVPMPCDSPHRLITRPRRRGEMRSLTTEKPTEPTAPRPTAATSCAAEERPVTLGEDGPGRARGPDERADHEDGFAVGAVAGVRPADGGDRGHEVADRGHHAERSLADAEGAADRRVERRHQADRHVVQRRQHDEDGDAVDAVELTRHPIRSGPLTWAGSPSHRRRDVSPSRPRRRTSAASAPQRGEPDCEHARHHERHRRRHVPSRTSVGASQSTIDARTAGCSARGTRHDVRE